MRVKTRDIGKDIALHNAIFELNQLRKCESPFRESETCTFGFKPCPYAAICRSILELKEELVNPIYEEYIEI